MLKQRTLRFLSERSLPLRSEKLSTGPYSTLALAGPIWFTPEVIVLDAFYSLARLASLWKIILKGAPAFAFRIASLVILFFVAIGFQQYPGIAVADSYQASALDQNEFLLINTQITAAETPIFHWPVPRSYITTYFSFYHQGIDIPTAYGSPVRPTDEGRVVSAGWNGGFGNIVVSAHKGGYVSKYAHLSGVKVAAGQVVSRETTLGWIGTTGIATGAHLHFEIHKDGPLDPINLLP